MKTKNIPINPKKIPYYLALILLTIGASLILGFLSFGGMYALLPILPLAFAAFGLSVAYEGEIYLQNIKGALGKLFKNNYLRNHMANEYLRKNFPATDGSDCPQFFKDYEKQLQLLEPFSHKKLTKQSKKQKKQIEKTLKAMEKWFAEQLFPAEDEEKQKTSKYAKELSKWLAKKEQKQEEWQIRLLKRRNTFHLVGAFSTIAATFMGLGSTYLIVEAFSVIPVMAVIPFVFWPLIIVPMAVIAGAAYGLLTYNTITDLINNDTLNKWYKKIRADLKEGLSARNVFMATMAVLLVTLAVALTVCTAGTWWTVATSARPLFEWMRRMPSYIMGVINPIITGISALSFNFQNTAESLKMLYDALHSKTNLFQKIYQSISKGWAHVRATENWWQIVNPFRIILKLTVTPLRILLFFGHLASIALTADRVPGIPQILAALIAIISEGFEDAHYFVGHSHEHNHEHHDEEKSTHEGEHAHDKQHKKQHHEEHQQKPSKHTKHLLKERLGSEAGHSHDADIPTTFLKGFFSPLYALAAGWDYLASKRNPVATTEDHDKKVKLPRVLTLAQAWNKQRGIEEEVDVPLSTEAQRPSDKWQAEHTLLLLKKYEKKHLNEVIIGTDIAEEKKLALQDLREKIRKSDSTKLPEILNNAKDNQVYNKHRLFASKEPTATHEFIKNLPQQVMWQI